MVVVVKNRHRENVLLRVSRKRSLRLHSLAQKEAGHSWTLHTEKTLSYFFYVFHKKEKKKQRTWFVCKWEPKGALKPVYAYTRGAIVAINLNFITPLWSFQNSKYELTTDLKEVQNIVLFFTFFPFKLCSLRLYFIVFLWSFLKQKIKATLPKPNYRIHIRPHGRKYRSTASFPTN